MLWCIFDLSAKEKELVTLETLSGQPDFWNDQRRAQDVMRRISDLGDEIRIWNGMEKEVSDLLELVSLAIEESDSSFKSEVHADVDSVISRLKDLEFKLSFNGEHDRKNAILAIHAGAGGTESQDWADMLLRMYIRWAERRNYQSEVFDISQGEEVGIKSAILDIRGDYSYGYLKSEHGVHRLVRLSPFDADHARHTSFALVEVLPEAEGESDVVISPDDLKVETFKSSGPGGQHMQKTSSAVRFTHIPTGLVVTCQSERSQHQNKEIALRILRSRLLEIEMKRQAEERMKMRGKHVEVAWGNQIRSYVLHPYRMVKDHRTGCQVENTTAVLDGDLDRFIEASLRAAIGKKNG
ncbi:MAG: peptide chain release factor 2 [Dehalococcoidia bacterium]|nr:peptide chain release factor 2 [Dehalococcoidia bacterium]